MPQQTERSERKNSMFSHVYACILAGGSGTRFWPLSRRKRPKQLLSLLGKETLLEHTAARIRSFVPPDRTYVFTSELVRKEILRLLPEIPPGQVVAEPASRNTAPAIGLAAHEILSRDPHGIMVVLPSDHVIAKPGEFRRVLRAACRWAWTEGRSVVVGLAPTRAETGYGYVRRGGLAGGAKGRAIYRIERFTEKPDRATARRYLASGKHLWNGGMFIWRASTLLANLERFQPRMARQLARIARAGGVRAGATLKRLYPRLEKISIDYALMEKIPGRFVVPADIGWSDVGSWAAAYELAPKDGHANVRPRQSLAFEARGNMIVSRNKFVVAVGVRDLVVVETDDALLLSTREHSQDVGKAVRELERQKRSDLL